MLSSQSVKLLIWAGGDASGNCSVKNLYAAILFQKPMTVDRSWRRQIWGWGIPLKLKLFIWLAGNGNILAWDALTRRGWEGPGICLLCRLSSEDVSHLLVHCHFTKEVWNRLLSHYSIKVSWSGPNLSDCFSSWISKKNAPPTLAAHTCWQLWAERNSATFENRPPSVSAVLHRILSNFQWQASSIKTFPHKICDITLAVGHTLACFDGAASSNGLCCGAGGFFKSHPRKITKWFLCCGEGINTKAELLGLWPTLTLASLWSINQLLVLGDSRIVIDWASQKSSLHSVSIESWLISLINPPPPLHRYKFPPHFQKTQQGGGQAIKAGPR